MDARTSNFILLGIVIAIVLAFASVALFGEAMASVEWLGTLFLKALKMMIVPLVTASMIVGVAGLGDVRKLGRLGGNTLLYFLATTVIAVAIGLLMVNLIRPGDGINIGALAVPVNVAARQDFAPSDLVLSLVSDNIVASMANLELLPVIVFSLVFGAVLTTLGPVGTPVIAFFRGVNEAIMKMVMLLMLVAPIGIFGLVAGRFARAGNIGEMIGGVGWYMATVLLALALHALVVLPAILWFFGRRNPWRYMFNMGTALLTAFSTASSSATLPLTMEGVEKHNGISEKVAGFVVLLTATLAAIGAAGIPEAGLVTMVIVLKAVGLPLEGIGLILAVDWLLDRFRTSVNVWGDAVGAAVIERHVLDGAGHEEA